MQIISVGNRLVALTRTWDIYWIKGSHTARVYRVGQDHECDLFTFGWAKNETQMLDFTEALQNWMEYCEA